MAYNKNAPTECTVSNNLHIKSFASGIANMVSYLESPPHGPMKT